MVPARCLLPVGQLLNTIPRWGYRLIIRSGVDHADTAVGLNALAGVSVYWLVGQITDYLRLRVKKLKRRFLASAAFLASAS